MFQALTLTLTEGPTTQPTRSFNYQNSQSAPLFELYFPLWLNILDSNRTLQNENIAKETIQSMNSTVYDQLITSIIAIIEKLNLSTRQVNNNVLEANLGLVVPNVVKDFEIFSNLVGFCVKLISKVQKTFFTRWIYIFGKLLIQKSNEFPFVTGFYKLLTMVMNLSEQLEYFNSVQEVSVENQLKVDIENSASKISYVLFSKFVDELCLKLQSHRDDLLSSSIELIMSLPKELLPSNHIVLCFRTAFKMGLSSNQYLYVAEKALYSLEKWIKMLPQLITPHLEEILPDLNDYLKLHLENIDVNQKKSKKKYKRAEVGAIKKKQVNVSNQKGRSTELQFKILRFLGKLGSLNYGISSVNETNNQDIAWDTIERIKFQVPLYDMKPSIYFDQIFPRIIVLAEKANDRQTKIAACELLHSLVLYMVGSNANNPRRDTQTQSVTF